MIHCLIPRLDSVSLDSAYAMEFSAIKSTLICIRMHCATRCISSRRTSLPQFSFTASSMWRKNDFLSFPAMAMKFEKEKKIDRWTSSQACKFERAEMGQAVAGLRKLYGTLLSSWRRNWFLLSGWRESCQRSCWLESWKRWLKLHKSNE